MKKYSLKSKVGRYRTILRLCGVLLIIAALSFALFRPMAATAAQATVDGTVASGNTDWKVNNGADTVFISDTVGYAFYRGGSTGSPLTNNRCAYSKTTNGGTSWGTPVVIHDTTSCIHVSVWYDRWTPGDTTGTLLHLGTADSTTGDVHYNTLDTANSDTLGLSNTTMIAVSSDMTNSITAGTGRFSITKATDGTIYIGLADFGGAGDQTWVKKCASSCLTTQANWTSTGFSGLQNTARDEMTLMPLASGNILMTGFNTSADDVVSKVYTNGTNTWDASFTTIDAAAPENTNYGGFLGVTLRKSTGDIYLAYTAETATLGSGDGAADDIRTAVYSSGSWTAKTGVLTNDTKGLLNVKLAIDDSNGDLYAVYTAQTTAGTASTGNIYYKKSTDGMTTWGTESAALNTAAGDLWGARVNIMSDERIYVTWHDPDTTNPDKLYANTVADLAPSGATFAQSNYRWFGNNNNLTPDGTFAAEDTAASVACGTGPMRLRTALSVSGSAMTASSAQFKLQYGTSTSGPWRDVDIGAAQMSDTFTGTNGAAWNTSNWVSVETPSGSSTSIQSNAGRMTTPTNGNYDYIRRRANITALADSEIRTSFRVDSAESYARLWLRADTSLGGTGGYGYNLLFLAGQNISIQEMNASSIIGDAFGSFGHVINTTYSVRFQALGGSVRAKVWVEGTAEPGAWSVEYNDATPLVAGSVGISATADDFTGTYNYTFDDFTVYDGDSSPLISNFDNPGVSDGATLTAAKLSGSPTLQSYSETGLTASNPNSVAVSGKGEWDFSLNAAAAPVGTYYLRMVKSDGTALNTYTVYPALTITAAPAMDSMMRGGTFFAGEAKQPMACSFTSAPT